MKNPVVVQIDTRGYTGQSGSRIFIYAWDSVKVEEVSISLVSADGVLIEQGKAEEIVDQDFQWIYECTQVNNESEVCKVIAVVKNLPGNEGVLERDLVSSKSEQLK